MSGSGQDVFPGDWQEFLARVKETPGAIRALWQDPMTHDLMRYYLGILVVIGLVFAFRFYLAAKRKSH
jgi:hypothetical protein